MWIELAFSITIIVTTGSELVPTVRRFCEQTIIVKCSTFRFKRSARNKANFALKSTGIFSSGKFVFSLTDGISYATHSYWELKLTKSKLGLFRKQSITISAVSIVIVWFFSFFGFHWNNSDCCVSSLIIPLD